MFSIIQCAMLSVSGDCGWDMKVTERHGPGWGNNPLTYNMDGETLRIITLIVKCINNILGRKPMPQESRV